MSKTVVKRKNKVNDDKSNQLYPSSEILKEACFQEYQNAKEKYNKLYDKINFTLAFCGIVFFQFITLSDISAILSYKEKLSTLHIIVIVFYVLLIITTLGFFMWALFDLLLLAKGKKLAIFNCIACRDSKKYNGPPEAAALWLVEQYTNIIAENKDIIEEKQTKYNESLNKIIISIILYIIIYIIDNHVVSILFK